MPPNTSADVFQHTAARRRLGRDTGRLASHHGFNTQPPEGGWLLRQPRGIAGYRFNTQPPEGGWPLANSTTRVPVLFQHTAARRRLEMMIKMALFNAMFQHTAARRRLVAVCKSSCAW